MAKTTVPKKDSAPKLAQLQIPQTVNIENVPSTYCNNLEVLAGGMLDVRIGFNEILVERGQPRRVAVIRRANIVMSYPHFKSMVELLNNTLKQIDTATTNEQRTLLGVAADALKK